MRKILPLAAAVICGAIIIADFLVQASWLQRVAAVLLEGGLILACFALLLGLYKVVTNQAFKIQLLAAGRWQSWIILVSLVFTVTIGCVLPASVPFKWVSNFIIVPVMMTLGALLAFYSITAAARLMRIRSTAAYMLLASCLFFLILWIPYINSLSPVIAVFQNWLYAVPLTASARGVLLGIAIGIVVAACRILFGLDHPYTGTEKR